jgi:hypothetical protein
MKIVVLWILGCCIIAIAIAMYFKNKADNRRINRYNRNVDRHNQWMDMLLKNRYKGQWYTDYDQCPIIRSHRTRLSTINFEL